MAYSFQAEVPAHDYHDYKNITWEELGCGDKFMIGLYSKRNFMFISCLSDMFISSWKSKTVKLTGVFTECITHHSLSLSEDFTFHWS